MRLNSQPCVRTGLPLRIERAETSAPRSTRQSTPRRLHCQQRVRLGGQDEERDIPRALHRHGVEIWLRQCTCSVQAHSSAHARKASPVAMLRACDRRPTQRHARLCDVPGTVQCPHSPCRTRFDWRVATADSNAFTNTTNQICHVVIGEGALVRGAHRKLPVDRERRVRGLDTLNELCEQRAYRHLRGMHEWRCVRALCVQRTVTRRSRFEATSRHADAPLAAPEWSARTAHVRDVTAVDPAT